MFSGLLNPILQMITLSSSRMNAINQLDECYHPTGWMLSSSWMNAIIQLDECYHPTGWMLSSSWMKAFFQPDECYPPPDECYIQPDEFFFSLYVFGEPAVPVRNFFLCCPSQRSARSQVPSQGGNPQGDWQSAVGWGDAGFEPGTAGQQSGALPLSYHASLLRYHASLWATTPPYPARWMLSSGRMNAISSRMNAIIQLDDTIRIFIRSMW